MSQSQDDPNGGSSSGQNEELDPMKDDKTDHNNRDTCAGQALGIDGRSDQVKERVEESARDQAVNNREELSQGRSQGGTEDQQMKECQAESINKSARDKRGNVSPYHEPSEGIDGAKREVESDEGLNNEHRRQDENIPGAKQCGERGGVRGDGTQHLLADHTDRTEGWKDMADHTSDRLDGKSDRKEPADSDQQTTHTRGTQNVSQDYPHGRHENNSDLQSKMDNHPMPHIGGSGKSSPRSRSSSKSPSQLTGEPHQETYVQSTNLSNEVKELRSKTQMYLSNNDDLKKQLQDKTLENERLGKEEREARQQVQDLQATVNKLKEQNSKFKYDSDSQVASHKKTIEELQSNLKHQDQLEKQRKKENGKLEKRLKKEQNRANNLDTKIQKQEKTQKDIEKKLETDLKQKTKTIEKLHKDAAELQRKAKDEHKSYHQTLERLRELEEYSKTTGQVILENEHLKKDIQQKHEELTRLQDKNRQLSDENHRLTESLSQEWSTKVSSDERNTENISVCNRPMTLKTEYENISSNEWLDAKTALDEMQADDEDSRRMFLCDILLRSEKAATLHYNEMMERLKAFLCQPLVQDLGVSQSEEHAAGDSSVVGEESDTGMKCKEKKTKLETKGDFSQELTNALGDHLRIHADTADASLIVESVTADLCSADESKPWYTNAVASESVQKYLSVCAKLTWKMATQRPKMTFSSEGECAQFDEKSQEPVYGSENPYDKQAVVMYYVSPALCHADSMMVKGRVITKILK